VTPRPVLTTGVAGARLALTGTDTGLLLRLSALLFFCGGLLLAGSRRRPEALFSPVSGRRSLPEASNVARWPSNDRPTGAKVQVSGPKWPEKGPSVRSAPVLNHSRLRGDSRGFARRSPAEEGPHGLHPQPSCSTDRVVEDPNHKG
jgi:hypothetical protein